MASIHKHSKHSSKNWMISFRVDGKQHFLSTKTDDMQVAQALRSKVEEIIRASRKRAQKAAEHRVLKVLSTVTRMKKKTTQKQNTQSRLDLTEITPRGVDKVTRYNWKMKDAPGEFHYLKKAELCIDHTYQRKKLSPVRIEEMARNWSWVSCGTLSVALREDNRWYIIDGQHRKLAADKRSDIKDLPCLVFEIDEIRSEARGFVDINTGKVGVSGVDKFNALVVAEDIVATGLTKLLKSTGHRVGSTPSVKTVACVMCLMSMFSEKEERLARMWSTIADVHNESPIMDCVVKGMWLLEKWLEKQDNKSLCASPYREKLILLGGRSASELIRKAIIAEGMGGARVYARTLARWLNKQRLPNGFKIIEPL